MQIKIIILAACAVLLLLFFAMPSHEPPVSSSVRITERLDSAMTFVDRRSSKIQIKSKLQARQGALVLDTIIDRDTVCVYIEPDSTIEIRLLPAPRIVQEWVKFMRRDSLIYQTAIEFIDRPWYESPLLIFVGAILGFLVAML